MLSQNGGSYTGTIVESFAPVYVILGLLFVGGPLLALIESESPGSARVIVLSVIGIGVVAGVIWTLKNVSFKEMADGMKYLLQGLAALVIIGIIFLPFTQCSGGGSSPTDSYYRR